MDRASIRKLLSGVRAGRVTVAEAEQWLRGFPGADLGFARLDTQRAARRGFPETIYGPGKSIEQIVALVSGLQAAGQTAVVTRVGPEVHRALLERHSGAAYVAAARMAVVRGRRAGRPRPGVVVLSAGTSDMGVAEEAAVTAEALGEAVIRLFDVGVAGLHRLLSQRETLSRANVVVAVAGMDGALPSVVAGLVDCPVIAVPTSVGYGTGTGGIAALLTMLNACSPGIGVVNIDNGHGAGCLASLINRRCARATPSSTRSRSQ